MKEKKLVDTNVLIRYLTNDTARQALSAEKLFRTSSKKSLVLVDVVIIEVAYVLLSVYELSKEEVIEKLNVIIGSDVFLIDRALWRKVLDIHSTSNISFVDSYLCALSYLKHLPLASFDKKLKSISDIEVHSP